MADTEQICAMAEQIKDELICDRRTIHAQPELAFQEEKTSAFVQARLQELGIEYKTGYAKTGVVGLIRGKRARAERFCCVRTWTACRSRRQTTCPTVRR